jgi:hypothetical protein
MVYDTPVSYVLAQSILVDIIKAVILSIALTGVSCSVYEGPGIVVTTSLDV